MKTKTTLTAMVCLGGLLFCEAQVLRNLDKRIEAKVNQRIERKANQAIDKGLDKVEEAATPGKKNSTKKPGTTATKPASEPEFSAATASDFIPGTRIIFSDDFQTYNTGDFPSRWNTNSSGSIATVKNQSGKWLRVTDNALIFPEIKGTLPQHFTIEFDLLYPPPGLRPPVTFGFTEVSNPAKTPVQHKSIFYFIIPSSVNQWVGYSTSLYSGRETTREWPADRKVNKKIPVSIAVNGTRIRLYIDGEKLFDLPRAFDKNSYRNNFHFRAAPLIPEPKDGFYISNLRIAEVK